MQVLIQALTQRWLNGWIIHPMAVIVYPCPDPDVALWWRHNDHDSVSNHQPHECLLNRLFRRRSKKTSKLRVTGLCVGISPGPVNSPHKGPVTRKMFPFDDVIMGLANLWVKDGPVGQGAPTLNQAWIRNYIHYKVWEKNLSISKLQLLKFGSR